MQFFLSNYLREHVSSCLFTVGFDASINGSYWCDRMHKSRLYDFGVFRNFLLVLKGVKPKTTPSSNDQYNFLEKQRLHVETGKKIELILILTNWRPQWNPIFQAVTTNTWLLENVIGNYLFCSWLSLQNFVLNSMNHFQDPLPEFCIGRWRGK